MKTVKEMTFDEFVDWAAGYLLTELIAGKFRTAVWLVCQQAIQWQPNNDRKKK